MGGASLSLSENGPDLCVAKIYFFGSISGEEFEVVQKEVAEMLKGRILVGHALRNDLKVPPFRAPRTPVCVRLLVGRFVVQDLRAMLGTPQEQYQIPLSEF